MAEQAEPTKIIPKKGKSWVWTHFGISATDSKKAVCKLCFKEYSYQGEKNMKKNQNQIHLELKINTKNKN